MNEQNEKRKKPRKSTLVFPGMPGYKPFRAQQPTARPPQQPQTQPPQRPRQPPFTPFRAQPPTRPPELKPEPEEEHYWTTAQWEEWAEDQYLNNPEWNAQLPEWFIEAMKQSEKQPEE